MGYRGPQLSRQAGLLRCQLGRASGLGCFWDGDVCYVMCFVLVVSCALRGKVCYLWLPCWCSVVYTGLIAVWADTCWMNILDIYYVVIQAKSAASLELLSDEARLKLFLDGEGVAVFPVTVRGNELIQVEASFPAGVLMLPRTVSSVFCMWSLGHLYWFAELLLYINCKKTKLKMVCLAEGYRNKSALWAHVSWEGLYIFTWSDFTFWISP